MNFRPKFLGIGKGMPFPLGTFLDWGPCGEAKDIRQDVLVDS